ncbi:hypothetical protein TNCT_411601 [Trichonephila clavata]|uniref:Uncharacterized protein n=1 Tax=Trichonephila clavata TaxID=2740835 RepID=A0A8X6FA64_TRICU|nr:hypothetical protein TNCT_411601 [Trichonephila clavata]
MRECRGYGELLLKLKEVGCSYSSKFCRVSVYVSSKVECSSGSCIRKYTASVSTVPPSVSQGVRSDSREVRCYRFSKALFYVLVQ